MTLLLADRVWDGLADRPTERGFVAVGDGTIVAVGRQTELGTRFDADQLVTLPSGTTLLPGLIDCHQHLCFDGSGSLEEQVTGIDDDALSRRAHATATTALAGGVTTVRDLGDRSYVTLALRDDPSLPTIVAGGPPLTLPGGHCWYLGGTYAGEDELRRVVQERAERGCDVIKVMVTGGALTTSFPMWNTQFSDAEMRAVVDEAHRAGLPVAAHCHGVGGIVQALDAGADSIEHCSFDAGINRSTPHDVLPRSLADLVECGMTAVDGLRALTTVAARVCGLADRQGRLAAGFDADLLAVAGDPADDPQALTDVVRVWRGAARFSSRPEGTPPRSRRRRGR